MVSMIPSTLIKHDSSMCLCTKLIIENDKSNSKGVKLILE